MAANQIESGCTLVSQDRAARALVQTERAAPHWLMVERSVLVPLDSKDRHARKKVSNPDKKEKSFHSLQKLNLTLTNMTHSWYKWNKTQEALYCFENMQIPVSPPTLTHVVHTRTAT